MTMPNERTERKPLNRTAILGAVLTLFAAVFSAVMLMGKGLGGNVRIFEVRYSTCLLPCFLTPFFYLMVETVSCFVNNKTNYELHSFPAPHHDFTVLVAFACGAIASVGTIVGSYLMEGSGQLAWGLLVGCSGPVLGLLVYLLMSVVYAYKEKNKRVLLANIIYLGVLILLSVLIVLAILFAKEKGGFAAIALPLFCFCLIAVGNLGE